MYNYLKSSSKRQSNFTIFQKYLELKPHKILHPSQTRWLSLIAVVERLLEQWDALKLYFNDTYLSEKLIATEHIFHALNDPFIKLYYIFLEWSLPKFTRLVARCLFYLIINNRLFKFNNCNIFFRFNQYFQTQQVVITELHEKVVGMYKEILCFLERNYVMQRDIDKININNGEFLLPDHQLYLGAKVMININNPNIVCEPARRREFFDRYIFYIFIIYV